MKRISVKLVGSATAPFVIHVTPGMTAGKILASLDLEGSVLPIPPSPHRYFAPDDKVYDKLMEGDFLLVIPTCLSTVDLPKAREDLHQLLGIGDGQPMKRIWIHVPDSNPPVFKLQIRPGTKVSDVLSYLHLKDYVLLHWHGIPPLCDPTKPFPPEEVLYDLIESDAKLIAKLSPQAEAKYATTFLP